LNFTLKVVGVPRAQKANRTWWDTLEWNAMIRKNARKTLGELRSMKLQLAIVSNCHNHDALMRHLSSLGISSNFSHIFSSMQMGVRKPERRIFTRSLSLMKISRARPKEH
jgi:FMN phosphatase YigB (HAD superfamily)